MRHASLSDRGKVSMGQQNEGPISQNGRDLFSYIF